MHVALDLFFFYCYGDHREKGHASFGRGHRQPVPLRRPAQQVGHAGDKSDEESDETRPGAGHVEIKDPLDEAHGALGGRKEQRRVAGDPDERGNNERSDPVRFHPCLFHSSSKYSPKSHVAVKKTTSKATKKASQVRGSSGGSASSPEVASALAIRTGVSTGNRSSGSSSSRMRACEATAENTVPTVVNPSVPRISTNITGNKRSKSVV